jgi:hypothetical protein
MRLNITKERMKLERLHDYDSCSPFPKRRATTCSDIHGRPAKAIVNYIDTDPIFNERNYAPREAIARLQSSATRSEGQGTPVLAYKYGPHTEFVRDDETGILVNDSESMLAALLALARDADMRERFAAQTRAFAPDFSWKRSAKGLEEVILRATAIAAAAGNTHRPAIAAFGP